MSLVEQDELEKLQITNEITTKNRFIKKEADLQQVI